MEKLIETEGRLVVTLSYSGGGSSVWEKLEADCSSIQVLWGAIKVF